MSKPRLSAKKLALLARVLQKDGIGQRSVPIAPLEREGVATPVSFAQEQLWIQHRLDPDSPAYNVHVVLPVPAGPPAIVEQSLGEIVRRHEVLRATFPAVDGRPVQVVRDAWRPTLTCVDLSAYPPAERRRQFDRVNRQTASAPFDLVNGPVIRTTHVTLSADEAVLLLTLHHIVTDGWSMGVLSRELRVLTEAFAAGRVSPLDEIAVQYSDYAGWQRAFLNDAEIARALDNWKGRLDGISPLMLPTDRARPAVSSYEGSGVSIVVDQATTDALRDLSRRAGVTLFTTLLAGFRTLLRAYSGQDDIVVGVPNSNRDRPEVQPLIGYFVNMLALRMDLRSVDSVLDLLANEHRGVTEAFGWPDLPFERLVAAVAPERDPSRNPIFQVVFSFLDDRSIGIPETGTTASVAKTVQNTRFDLEAHCTENGDGLQVTFAYSSDLFEEATVNRFIQHYLRILRAFVATPNRAIGDLALVDGDDRATLASWGQPSADAYPRDTPLGRLFEARAAADPDAVALECGATRLTYAALNARANQIAHALRRRGVGLDARVGLWMPRGLDLIVAVLGVVKAGAAYVAVDPGDPIARVAGALEDAAVRVIVTSDQVPPAIAAGRTLLDVASANEEPTHNPDIDVPATALAYVAFTSGSTGRPKGVAVPHRGVVRLLHGQRFVSWDSQDAVLQLAPVHFDASTLEIWGALLHGGRLVIYPERVPTPEDLEAVINAAGVSTLWLTSSLYNTIIDTAPKALSRVRQLLIGGEALSVPHVRRGLALLPDTTLINGYGPTENTTFTCCYPIPRTEPPGSSVPLGPPIAHTSAYVLNESGALVPVGVPGELYAGGDGLARGYIGAPRETAARFVPDGVSGASGARLYRTGDRVRWRADGTLEFLGRRDGQIKLRGFRIELSEIETALLAIPGVGAAVAQMRVSGGDPRLVAYVTPAPGAMLDSSAVRSAVQSRLPAYMVPSGLMVLSAMPLTASGKLDRLALPDPFTEADTPASQALPTTPIERELARLWCEVLRVPSVSIHDNFFDLGGDSILSIQIVSRAIEAGLHFKPKHLFQHPTIAELATAIDLDAPRSRDNAPVAGVVPLTPIQRWFFEDDPEDAHHFNQAVLLQVSDELSNDLVERAVQQLLIHHDGLRSTFCRDRDTWRQDVALLQDGGALQRIDLSMFPEAEREVALVARCSEIHASFNLEAGPLFKAVLYDMGAGCSRRLLLVAHHLVVDGVSWRILIEDLHSACEQLGAYGAVHMPGKTTSYRDWAARLVKYATEIPADEIAYWQEVVSRLPRRQLRGTTQVRPPRRRDLSLPVAETSTLLQKAPRALQARFEELLLTAVVGALRAQSNSDDVYLDLEGHGRSEMFDDVDVSRTVGWFTTLYPVRFAVAANQPLEGLIAVVKGTLGEVPNGGIGYGALRYQSASPVSESLAAVEGPPVAFNYLGQFDQLVPSGSGLSVAAESSGVGRSARMHYRHALEIAAIVYNGQLRIEWTGDPQMYDEVTFDAIVERCQATLLASVAHGRAFTGSVDSQLPRGERIRPETWSKIAEAYPDIEDLFALTPTQQGMLFHTLLHPESGVYTELFTCRLEGVIDAEAFRLAWAQVAARHQALRSVFVWEGVADPLQIVRADHNLLWHIEDWSALAPDIQSIRLEERLQAEERRSFDFAKGPLIVLTLLRLNDREARFIWTFHHILLDGWSMALVLSEIFEAYDAIITGRTARFPPTAPFGNYVRWLETRRHRDDAAYWRALLGDLSAPTPLGIDRRGVSTTAASRDQTVRLSETLTAEIVAAARACRVTVNTFLLGVWSLLLSRYSGHDDVVFGMTVSGRPPTLPLGESIVGLFINTVPVRVSVPNDATVDGWLRAIQNAQAEQRDHEHVALVDIQRGSGVPQDVRLFESIVVFENYPSERRSMAAAHTLSASSSDSRHRSNFPLVIAASPGPRLLIRVFYDAARFDESAIAKLLADLVAAAGQLAADPKRSLADIPLPASPSTGDGEPAAESASGSAAARSDRQHDRPESPVKRTRTLPQTAVEIQVAAIWREVLGTQTIHVEDDFFELGGHSLLAIRALSRIRAAFQIELPLVELFERPALRDLAVAIEEAIRGGSAADEPELVAVPGRRNVPLSSAQQRLWFLDQLEPGSAAYNVPAAVQLQGALDADALDRAFTGIIRRHEVLRTTFETVSGEPVQVIGAAQPFGFRRIDLRHLRGDDERSAEALRLANLEALTPFDLRRGPLLRGSLLRLADDHHVLLVTLHHIVCDGWSSGLLVHELMALYEGYAFNREVGLDPLPVQYADFTVWHREWLSTPRIEDQLQYWSERLADCPVMDLPADRPRPQMPSHNGGCCKRMLPAALAGALDQIARQERATLFMTLLAAFDLLLSRYTGQSEIVVGTPVSVRPRKELEHLIGFFSNTLVVRANLGAKATFREIVRHVRDVALDAYANQDVPFERIIEAVQPERHLDRHPLFQVLFTAQHAPIQPLALPGLSLRPFEIDRMNVRFDLEVHVGETAEGFLTAFYFNSDIFDRDTIERLSAAFAALLNVVAARPDDAVEELDALPDAEARALELWNATTRPIGLGPTLQELFEAQVVRSPGAAALEFNGHSVTYADLNARANWIARLLRDKGVTIDDCVAIALPRGVEQMVCVLAVLKAGAAYLPLDLSYPSERLAYMLRDGGAKVLLTESRLLSHFAGNPSSPEPLAVTNAICLDLQSQDIDRHHESNLAVRVDPDHLAYVLYTSGSTGRPKGIAMAHRPLLNLLEWQLEVSGAHAAGRTVQYAPLSFDPSFLEMFSTWARGGTLVLIDEDLRRDFFALVRFLHDAEIGRIYITPAALHQLADASQACGVVPRSLREVNAAGERLEVTRQIATMLGQIGGCTLFNQYGPAETHVVTAATLSGDVAGWPALPSIGVALPNTRIHLLDRSGHRVPVGVPGELYIAGDCLARGYLDNPRLTAERFLPDGAVDATYGGRLYRSGDLARYRSGGAIEYLGRADHQVKIRGYRIELGEIEAVITQHPDVLDAAVDVREGMAGRQVVAFVVPRNERSFSAAELRRHVATHLPDYMIPSVFESIAQLPLTPSGKVDRRALPTPTGGSELGRHERPRTALEARMLELWSEILGVTDIGVHDDFFVTGGHSLLAAQLVSRVRREWDVELRIRTIFEQPTVALLSERVEALRSSAEGQSTAEVAAGREEGVV